MKVFEPYQVRVIDECEELGEKLAKLEPFIGSEPFNALDSENQMLLQKQQIAMINYRDILRERISLFF